MSKVAAAVTPPTVVIAEFMDPAGRQRLASMAEVRYLPQLGEDRGGLLDAVAGAQAIVVRNRCQVDAALLAAAGPDLRVVGRLGVGLDNIDLAACRSAGVRVVFARGANSAAVCEFVFAGLLHLLRRLGQADAAVRGGTWPREAYAGEELGGRTLGILGLGEVGRRLVAPAVAFGMSVLGYDPLLPLDAPALRDLPLTRASLDRTLEKSDVLTLHLPLTPETAGMIGDGALRRMRPGAILVHTARGGIVDETALAEALTSGRLRGAILDVRVEEPPRQPDPLAALPGVLLTPHVAGLTAEAQVRVGQVVAEDVLAVLVGHEPVAAAV